MTAIMESIKQFALDRVLLFAALAVACLLAVKILLKLFDRLIRKTELDPAIARLVRIALKAVLLSLTAIIALGALGISVSSLVATLSVVGVAVSLAIQGFLSNVFGGIQIISNKPFHIGDYVEAGEESGTVREVGLFYTKLDTPDKKLIQIPNSTIANSSITNYSSAVNRRVDIAVSASYEDEVEKVRAVLLELLVQHPLVLHGEGLDPVVHVSAYADSNIDYIARAWCDSGHYWTVYYDIMDAIKPTFNAHGITISYPHVVVDKKE